MRKCGLLDLAVSPEARRQGIATVVMHGLIAQARSAGVPLTLSVWPANDPARRLYDRLGFVPAPGPADDGYHHLRLVGAQ